MAVLYTGVRVGGNAMKRGSVLSIFLLITSTFAYAQFKYAEAAKAGQPAPRLTFTNADLLQVPQGVRPNWDYAYGSLRGKVVVLEFLCTWSKECVSEIPEMNHLADSTNSSKVQFVVVDYETDGYIENYLKSHPIRGWIITNSAKSNGRRWGVGPLPAIFVIDTKGNVVLMTLHPEHLRPKTLLKLAKGEDVPIENKADAVTDAQTWQAIKDAQQQQAWYDGELPPLFSFSITPGPGGFGMSIRRGGKTSIAISNATPDKILSYVFGIPPSRLKINGSLSKATYDFSLRAPSLEGLAPVVDHALEYSCGVRIERHTTMQDVYLLKATDKAQYQPLPTPIGFGHYSFNPYGLGLNLRYASIDDLASALEEVLNRPVVNESGVSGAVTAKLSFVAADFEPVKAALEQSTGFTLVPARHPIETITIAPGSDVQRAASR